MIRTLSYDDKKEQREDGRTKLRATYVSRHLENAQTRDTRRTLLSVSTANNIRIYLIVN